MKPQKINISIQKQNFQDSYEDSSQNFTVISNIEELNVALEKLKIFINQLSNKKMQQYQDQIILYSQKKHLLEKKSSQITQLCEKRIQKMLRNKKAKKNWNQDDLNLLIWIINKYCSYYTSKSIHNLQQNDWKFISALIPASTWKKCMFRWLSLKKFSLLSFKWSVQESKLLTKLIKQQGKKDWKKISEKLYVQNNCNQKIFRTPKQCRQHWNCYLNPTIKKGPWSIKEDIRLLQNVLELNCMKKWSQIAKNIKGRTQNAVKNRFTLLIDKEKKNTGQQNQKIVLNRSLVRLLHQQAHIKNSSQNQRINQDASVNSVYQKSQQNNKANFQQPVQNSIKSHFLHPQNNPNIQQNNMDPSRIIIPKIIINNQYQIQAQLVPFRFSYNSFYFNFFYGNSYPIN